MLFEAMKKRKEKKIKLCLQQYSQRNIDAVFVNQQRMPYQLHIDIDIAMQYCK
jgi:hypothetical protein